MRPSLTRLFACTAALVAAGHSPLQATEPADLVLRGGRVYTMTASPSPVASAVVVAGGRIAYVGDAAGAQPWIGPRTAVVELNGRTVLPGLVDAHGHLDNLGRLLREPNLIGATSVAQAVARVREFQRTVAPGTWIHGRGWDQNDWPVKSFPDWRDLEATGDNPVYLDRVDGHAIWVNRAALDAAGITRDTPDPPGGRIVRDERGEPTGVFVDEAEKLIEAHVPPAAAAEFDARLALAAAECARFGLTGVHDAGTSREVFESLERLAARGELAINVYCMIDSDDPEFALSRMRAGPASAAGGAIVARSLKLRADGALGSRGAALLEDYADEPGNRGLVVQPPESLLAWAERALRRGFQAGTHAIGDRGNRLVLDAYETALARAGGADARLRIEHAQVLAPGDIGRFARLGVVAAMQPTHATSDMPWAEARVGPERIRGAYVWRALLDAGVVLAFGSDFPVEAVDPMQGIYAAVTRQDGSGRPPGGWYPAQCLGVEEAVRAFTWGAAYAAFDEREAGTIETGKRADLTVVDRDVFAIAPREIPSTRAAMTVVRGRVVFDRSAAPGTDWRGSARGRQR